MAWEIERAQRTTLGHRLNFVGRSVSVSTIAWDYETQTWPVERPGNGEPVRRCSVTCRTCRRRLTYRVYSVTATRRRRIARRTAAVVCLVAVIPLVLVATIDPDDVILLSIAFGGSALALVLSFSLVLVAAADVGIAGHGSWWPGHQKHKVFPRSVGRRGPAAKST